MQERLQRGMALAEEGAALQKGDLWVVKGSTRNYTVNLDDAQFGATCTCPDYKERIRGGRGPEGVVQCKHIIAAVITDSRDRKCAGVA